MVKQCEIIEPERASDVFKQAGKVPVVRTQCGARFELIDEAGARQ